MKWFRVWEKYLKVWKLTRQILKRTKNNVEMKNTIIDNTNVGADLKSRIENYWTGRRVEETLWVTVWKDELENTLTKKL